ncbi:hypothetical protein [Methylobacterium dankookense]|uniref:Uncharacterized protein n=1 Tax=Methylobacterium dankookense TaxID=560405 RepID=A0A564G141_9HYPH|nr:hypothetical protein [Methylobacterium dankookense]GJD58252.1 hypothetical protein IFDJLNFL_4169 [Methylobacterium dankookense]VUF14179.1 hypothetical protein MTDSW087_03895 [Methylobacterium dankookense]
MDAETDDLPPLSDEGAVMLASAVTMVERVMEALGGMGTDDDGALARTLTLAALGGFIGSGGFDMDDDDQAMTKLMCTEVIYQLEARQHAH